jgi:transcriptional regulator with PAS, ATPase and Fis domain
MLERIVLLGPTGLIDADELPAEVRFSRIGPLPTPRDAYLFELPDTGIDLETVERGFVEQALAKTKRNQTAAAKLLGITRYQLRYRMEKFGIETG